MGNDYSRDETEFGAFGDTSAGPDFSGWFDSIAKATGLKTAAEKSFSKQTGTPITLQLRNPTAGQLASGIGKSAVMLAPIVATAGGGALLAAPALAVAAPVARSLAPVVSAARSAGISLTTTGGLSLKTTAGADALVKAADLGDVNAKAQLAALLKPGAVLDANAKLALANVKAAQQRASVPVVSRPFIPIAPTARAIIPPAPTARALPQPVVSPPRLAFAPGGAFVSVPVKGAIVARPPPLAPLAKGIAPQPATLPALQRYTATAQPTDPKYLVLDSGQVLANEYAKQGAVPGWLVRFDGKVLRQ